MWRSFSNINIFLFWQEAKVCEGLLVIQGLQASTDSLEPEVSQDQLDPMVTQDSRAQLDIEDLQDSLAFLEKWEIL